MELPMPRELPVIKATFPANEDWLMHSVIAMAYPLLILVTDQMLRFAVVFWMPAFAGMTVETGAHIRHGGESRHPGGFPKRKFSTSKDISYRDQICHKRSLLSIERMA
jgi:hypothetical protein